MSFSLTTDIVRATYRTGIVMKTVTRRTGWTRRLEAGQFFLAVEKGMGLKAGEKQKVLGLMLCCKIEQQSLFAVDEDECGREGFPEMSPLDFVSFFAKSHKGTSRYSTVTRIQFLYVFHCPTCGLPYNPFHGEKPVICDVCGETGTTSCCVRHERGNHAPVCNRCYCELYR